MKKWFLIVMVFFLSTKQVAAAGLESSTIRLSRMASGENPLPVLVEVSTLSNVTETGFRMVVNSAWSVNSGVTISTSQLPSGVTAWPGIGFSGVDGQQITFSSGDLTAGVTYGFYVTGGVGLNPSAGDSSIYQWQVMTLVGSTIDGQQYVGIPIAAKDTVVVTGKVSALASDFQIGLTDNSVGVLSQNQQIGYTLTYGANLHSPTYPLVLTATWGRGSVEGGGGLTVDVADYVVNSASDAYNGTHPVIDLVNRTITWTITSFPAQTTDQKVSFSLKTNSNYAGSSTVHFTVSGELNASKVVTVSSNQITESYQYASMTTPTPIATIVPTVELTGVPTATPVPVPVPVTITNVVISGLDATAATVGVEVSAVPQKLQIRYGLSPTLLSKSLIVLDIGTENKIKIEGLLPSTAYFFTVTADTTTSDVFTFITPSTPLLPSVFSQLLATVVSSDQILYDNRNTGQTKPLAQIILPVAQPYMVQFNLPPTYIIKLAQVWLRNKHVLGIVSAAGNDPNSVVADLINSGSNGYQAYLKTPPLPGVYEMYLRIYDFYGNIVEQKVGELTVILPVKVVDQNGKGIERAEVTFYYFTPARIYQLWRGTGLLTNPTYSESNGTVNTILIEGQYKMVVTAMGYKSKTMEFVVSPHNGYPQVSLERLPITIGAVVGFYATTISDSYTFVLNSAIELFHSGRFIQLLWVLMTGMLLFLGMLTWSLINHIAWWLLPLYLYRLLIRVKEVNTINGVVINDLSGYPISGAGVFLVDGNKNQVLERSYTGLLGNFSMKVPARLDQVRISVTARGYDPSPFMDFKRESLLRAALHFRLVKSDFDGSYDSGHINFGRFGAWAFLFFTILFGVMLSVVSTTIAAVPLLISFVFWYLWIRFKL